MKWLRVLGVAIGASLVGYMMHQVGLGSLRHSLGLLGWTYIPVLFYPVTWMCLNTLGWFLVCHSLPPGFNLLRLLAIRLAGETFNSLLPSGYVGGEPLKAKLLARWIPMRDAAASVLIAKAAQSVALVIFVGLGLTIAAPGVRSPLRQPATLTALAVLSVGIVLFVLILTYQSFSRLSRGLYRLTRSTWLLSQTERLQALDESLGSFYKEGKSRFLGSVLAHLGGWLAGALEISFIFFFLNHPISWRQAWFIGAMAQLAAVIGLFVPAGIGLYEGGHYVAAGLLGLDPALGLSVSLIRRVREVFWDGVGVYFFWRMSGKGE